MNIQQKQNLLRHFELLKTFGIEYCEHLDFEPQSMNHKNLPNDLNALHSIVSHCTLCQFAKSRKNVLFGYGNPNADILFVGDFNSTMEDSNGEYYVGNVGELLKNMIEKVLKIKKEAVYITNLVKCLPNDAQKNLTNEINICKEYLYKQIEIIDPKIIVIMGEEAFHYFTNETNWIKVRGNIIKHKKYTILPIHHPNMLMRNPTLKKDAYADMLKLDRFINESQ